MKLISNTAFSDSGDKYSKLLNQQLQLCFFVPCDENENVYTVIPSDGNTCFDNGTMYAKKYFEAKGKILFDGFEWVGNVDSVWIVKFNHKEIVCLPKKATIEWLLTGCEELEGKEITLTESAQKQIGL